MKERNVDKIKRLEHELGRYRKKVRDQANELELLRDELEAADYGNRETQALVDALMTAVVLAHGDKATDPDTGEQLGYNLSVPMFSVEEMREKYEIHARADREDGTYTLGVIEREKPNADGQNPA